MLPFVGICKGYLKLYLRNFLLDSITLTIVFMLYFKSLGLFIFEILNSVTKILHSPISGSHYSLSVYAFPF